MVVIDGRPRGDVEKGRDSPGADPIGLRREGFDLFVLGRVRWVSTLVAPRPQEDIRVGVGGATKDELAGLDEVVQSFGLGLGEGTLAPVHIRARIGAASTKRSAPARGPVSVEVHTVDATPIVAAVFAPHSSPAGANLSVVLISIGVEHGDEIHLSRVDETSGFGVGSIVGDEPVHKEEGRRHREWFACVVDRVKEDLGLILVDIDVVRDLDHPNVSPFDALSQADLFCANFGVVFCE